MSLAFGNKQFRNLQQQVWKNMTDIEGLKAASEVLNSFGIEIIGKVDTPEELPSNLTYDGRYGDAYLVGTSLPYSYWVWTRPLQPGGLSSWVDVGIFPAPGPQGEQGPKGDQGEQGAPGRGLLVSPIQPVPEQVGQAWLNTATYNLYESKMANDILYWNLVGSIQGPIGPIGAQGVQGPQGEPGPKGDQGPQGPEGRTIHIVDIVAGDGDLPDPTLVPNSSYGYLVGNAAPYNLYVVVGETAAEHRWVDLGSATYGAQGSTVTVNGLPVDTFNADTKRDVVTGNARVYVVNSLGNQSSLPYATEAIANSIPLRTNNMTIKTGEPAQANDAANKEYVDTVAATKVTINTTQNKAIVYGTTTGPSGPTPYDYEVNVNPDFPAGGKLAFTNSIGNLSVATPTNPNHAASKAYVDSKVSDSIPPVYTSQERALSIHPTALNYCNLYLTGPGNYYANLNSYSKPAQYASMDDVADGSLRQITIWVNSGASTTFTHGQDCAGPIGLYIDLRPYASKWADNVSIRFVNSSGEPVYGSVYQAIKGTYFDATVFTTAADGAMTNVLNPNTVNYLSLNIDIKAGARRLVTGYINTMNI